MLSVVLASLFDLVKMLVRLYISVLSVSSRLVDSFFFFVAYLMVSFRTVPFISSQRVFGFASLLIVLISLYCVLCFLGKHYPKVGCYLI